MANETITRNENSVITYIRRHKLCLASSDATKPLAPITHIAFGDGGVDENGEPVAPSELQTALVNEIARLEIDSVTYPDETTARYACTIPKGELLAGASISEAALVDSDGDLSAIQTMYIKRKDSIAAFTLEIDDVF